MGHISHILIPLIAVFTDEIVACSYKVLRSKGSLAQNRALCEHSSSCQLACVNLYVPHRRFQLWTQKTQATPRKGWRQHPRIDVHRGKKKKQPKNTVSSVAQMLTGFCTCTLRIFFLSFLFVLSFEVIYGSYYRSRTISWVTFFQRIRKNRTQKIFENNNFLVFGVIV